MKSMGSRMALALNAAVTLALLALVMARFIPNARAWVASFIPTQASASTLTITRPGASSATIAGYVLGDVASPGVYTLPSGARVQDLVAAAGGALPDADLARVDLAAWRFADGGAARCYLLDRRQPFPCVWGVRGGDAMG